MKDPKIGVIVIKDSRIKKHGNSQIKHIHNERTQEKQVRFSDQKSHKMFIDALFAGRETY